MNVYQNMNEAYPALVKTAMDTGEKANPRGFTCRELRPFSFTLLDPSRSIYGGRSRRLSARFWAIETLSYLAGLGRRKWHAELLVMANRGMASYRNEETGLFDGAYGPRIAQSLPAVVELLKRDPDSRQAVCSIWSPGIPSSKDVPCTVMLHFVRSRGRLDLVVYMRSNDLNWGTPYDVPAFCAIQLHVARLLGWPVGSYHHHCGSLHVYENENDDKGQPGPPRLAVDGESWEERIVPALEEDVPVMLALSRVYHARAKGEDWLEVRGLIKGLLPEPWVSMIAEGEWRPIDG